MGIRGLKEGARRVWLWRFYFLLPPQLGAIVRILRSRDTKSLRISDRLFFHIGIAVVPGFRCNMDWHGEKPRCGSNVLKRTMT